jgi:hypothetical protein
LWGRWLVGPMPVMGTNETGVGTRAHPVLLVFVVDELGLEHQLCLAHVRKAVTNRLKKVEGWEEEKATSSGWFVNCPEVVALTQWHLGSFLDTLTLVPV